MSERGKGIRRRLVLREKSRGNVNAAEAECAVRRLRIKDAFCSASEPKMLDTLRREQPSGLKQARLFLQHKGS
ncbi:hypothetical protein LSTR_LSTR016051 [Laodelphax striatellus]|uniref:Uncharacterized protein n=1 Tax=Laodelphax striatellus TaxID=195883 RepID=A0A482X644_LAOST|nr:hypothetical protein LSTR_LSTR015084 [Laodelphax striatellus]RZF45094.1 hypothetical protein LSTR_LSTR016051 [Laodelphax striatellus]